MHTLAKHVINLLAISTLSPINQ